MEDTAVVDVEGMAAAGDAAADEAAVAENTAADDAGGCSMGVVGGGGGAPLFIFPAFGIGTARYCPGTVVAWRCCRVPTFVCSFMPVEERVVLGHALAAPLT